MGDSGNTQDSAAMPPASAGSVAGDITTRLRQTRADMIGTDDEGHYFDCHEAAGEIDRLRSRLRFADAVIRSGGVAELTSAERTAIQRLAEDYEKDGEPASEGLAATLRGLLERLARLSPPAT